MSVLKKGKVVGKWTVRLPAGSVADAASNPAHLSLQLGALLRDESPPLRASTAKTLKLTPYHFGIERYENKTYSQ